MIYVDPKVAVAVKPPQLGISLHTLTTDLSERGLRLLEGSAAKTLELKQTLFDGPRGAEHAATLRNFLQQSGIVAATIHASFGGPFDISVINEAARAKAVVAGKAAIDLATYFDASIIVMHASAEPIDPAERPARIQQAQTSLRELEGHARRSGRRIAVELLPRTCLGNTVEELLEIVEPLDAAVVGFCLDTNHMMAQYQDVPKAVHQLGKRLFSLHLSDYDGVDEQHWLPGTGVVDWPAFMQALRDIDYVGPFIYECSFRPTERLRMVSENYQWLSKL